MHIFIRACAQLRLSCNFASTSKYNIKKQAKKAPIKDTKSMLQRNVSRILCVAEKNDAAKSISSILSNNRAFCSNGRSKYNKIYTFDMELEGRHATFVFTSVSGHLTEYEFEQSCKNWDSYPIEGLFNARILRTVPPTMKDIEITLKEESRKAKTLIIWTDCDREGENIGAEIVGVCRKENPGLQIRRARFSEITRPALMRALRNLDQVDLNQSNAVDCRMELDLRIGAAFTRLQTLNLRRSDLAAKISAVNVISYGSCQFPTLGFIVERYYAIKNFVSEPFWRLIGKDNDSPQIEFTWEQFRVFDQDIAKVFKDACDEENGRANVIKVDKKPKSKFRPQPMNTVEMEKLAIRKLKINSKRVMTAAERLYQKGYISYPRTETNIFPKELDLVPIVRDLARNNLWGNFATNEILNKTGPNPRNGARTDKAHPPIYPVKNATETELGGKESDEWKIYELVARHFLACISRNATGEETKVSVEVGPTGKGEIFNATGLRVEDPGYLLVYPWEKWADKTMPLYRVNQQLKNFVVSLVNGRTEPPKLLTEADLIGLMDKFGIGTDATHSDHIEKIKTRAYTVLNRENRFEPTRCGLSLLEGYKNIGIVEISGYHMDKPDLRALLEVDLQKISSGEKTREQVLKQQLSIYKNIFNHTSDKRELLLNAFRENLRSMEN